MGNARRHEDLCYFKGHPSKSTSELKHIKNALLIGLTGRFNLENKAA